MNRLTARTKNGHAYLVNVKPDEQEVNSPHKNTLQCILDCFERLAAYEDTGLEPENSRQHALQTGVCPMCEDCPDGCPVEAPNDSRNKQENEPLTLDEMNALDHEPIYVLHTGGKWTMNGWHIATASSYQNHGRCDLEIDNGNTIIDMQNYGKTWLAYRRKPERSEG